MRKRKVPESALDELMPVDDLSGMALYFGILRAVGKGIGTFVKDEFEAHRYLDHQFVRDSFNFTTCMVALAPISAVAALWFVPRLIAIALRKVRRPGYYEREKARRQALAHERLSTRRRTTLNPIPTPEALLAQFRRIRRNPREMLIFGSMLEDLEAYVDNSLVRDPDGTIVGRKGGIKQWLWENCAELGKRYHTVMRYKALAKRFKQAIDLEDPIPVAYALTAAEAPDSDVADHAGGGDVGGTEDMQLRCGQKSHDAGNGAGDGERGGNATTVRTKIGRGTQGGRGDTWRVSGHEEGLGGDARDASGAGQDAGLAARGIPRARRASSPPARSTAERVGVRRLTHRARSTFGHDEARPFRSSSPRQYLNWRFCH